MKVGDTVIILCLLPGVLLIQRMNENKSENDNINLTIVAISVPL